MFEGKPPKPGAGTPIDLDGDLRPVTWTDLVARLDAARGLRTAFVPPNGDGDGSFDPLSARHIAALGGGKPDINLEVLGNGKATDGISLPHTKSAAGGDPRD